MKKMMTLAMIAIFGLMISGVDQADAKRFGMGSSFGKQRMSQPKSNSFSNRQATPAKSATASGQRGGARTGMMGMIGGLALGGILGAMFFGGAFEGINFFDILIIGGIIALLFFFLRKRAPARQQPSYAGASSTGDFAHDFDSADETIVDDTPRQPVGTAVRPDINEHHFLPAAKEIYVRMQKAWDSGDIEDIRKFCTAEIAERIGQDMRPDESHTTDVATLNAEIADSWMESDLEWVAVNYTAMLREQTLDSEGTTTGDNTTEVNEVWIFRHAPQSDDPTWYLAGIQQAK
ncbi:Tim44 domain-containing protein [Mariprofundus sp. EBB-1]|uniref:Tim44 domain-containing protein n=1 Tax=Mariprofundus sp. EBB-1 TaxID=2650971 RepID=UPI000EF1FF01|nr:TIM44-like domain-containing protein [Mariprofundus sp. EBB-1]RLL52277.1 Tim44 domain-containing protein [Mariprofundus sp. EBB-1]